MITLQVNGEKICVDGQTITNQFLIEILEKMHFKEICNFLEKVACNRSLQEKIWKITEEPGFSSHFMYRQLQGKILKAIEKDRSVKELNELFTEFLEGWEKKKKLEQLKRTLKNMRPNQRVVVLNNLNQPVEITRKNSKFIVSLNAELQIILAAEMLEAVAATIFYNDYLLAGNLICDVIVNGKSVTEKAAVAYLMEHFNQGAPATFPFEKSLFLTRLSHQGNKGINRTLPNGLGVHIQNTKKRIRLTFENGITLSFTKDKYTREKLEKIAKICLLPRKDYVKRFFHDSLREIIKCCDEILVGNQKYTGSKEFILSCLLNREIPEIKVLIKRR